MDLTRTTAAWLIAVIGALFAFVTYVQALRNLNAGVIMAIIGCSTMAMMWYLAKDAEDDPEYECSDYMTASEVLRRQEIRRRKFRDNR